MAAARATIAFVGLLVPVTGCLTEASGLDGTQWMLVEMGPEADLQAIDADSLITLWFIAGDDRVTGSLAWNTYYASYQADESNLTIGQPGGATLWCEPPEHMRLEHSYLDALRTARGYSLEEDRLVIYCDVIQLVYERIN